MSMKKTGFQTNIEQDKGESGYWILLNNNAYVYTVVKPLRDFNIICIAFVKDLFKQGYQKPYIFTGFSLVIIIETFNMVQVVC